MATATYHPERLGLSAPPPVVWGGIDRRYVTFVVGAVVLGLVFVFSATFPPADGSATVATAFDKLVRQFLFAAAGLVGMLALSRLRPERAVAAAPGLMLVGLVAMMLCRWGPLALQRNGSFCWLKLSESMSCQPSEFTKFAYVMLLAGFLSRPLSRRFTYARMVASCLAAMGLMSVALMIQKDLGMMVLVVGTTVLMLLLRGMRLLPLLLLVGFCGALGFAVARHDPKRWERLTVFMHPTEDPGGKGYHTSQMLACVARGGLAGVGLGMSPDKWGALPEADTDSIFSVVAGELGLPGVVLGVGLFLALAFRGLYLAGRSGLPCAWFLGSGVALCLAVQALMHMGVTTVSIPCTGHTLPFISYGGSSLMASLFAAGLVLSVSRYRVAREEEYEETEPWE